MAMLRAAAEGELGEEIPYAAMQAWLTVYRTGAKGESVVSAEQLEERYGDQLRA